MRNDRMTWKEGPQMNELVDNGQLAEGSDEEKIRAEKIEMITRPYDSK